MTGILTGPRFNAHLSIRWKLVIPFIVITGLVIAVLLPITTRLVARRIETEADRRLSEIAQSVAALIESSESKALLSANFVANLPEVTALNVQKGLVAEVLQPIKIELDLPELSYYAPGFRTGDPALYYGGPIVARFMQVSQDATRIRGELIKNVLTSGQAASGIAIAPQSSQIIGVAPVRSGIPRQVEAVILTAYYLDEGFINEIRDILDADVAIVKDNAVIVSTIDRASGYEHLLQEGMIDGQGGVSAQYLEYGDGANERLLAHPLVIDDQSQGTVLVAQPINNLFQVRQDIQIALSVFAGVVALISVLLGAAAFVTFARPLTNLTEATNRISGGALEQRVDSPYFLFKDEITDLSENFNRMTERLQEMYTTQEQRVREQERVEHELRVARRIQQLLLPKEMPMLQGWQMSAFYQPARAVGGDFYDYLALPDQRIGIAIGDVTDKGMPAALVMATTRSTLRAAALRVDSPGEALKRTNELLCPEIPPNMFVTCLYAILDPLSGYIKFANAGHNLPYCRMGEGVAKLRATGMPLGLMPDMVYEEGEAQLTPGDTLLLYSDGIVEAHNAKREMFSGDRLQNFLQAYRGEEGLIEDLMRELASFTGVGWEQEDDVTLVTLQRSHSISKN